MRPALVVRPLQDHDLGAAGRLLVGAGLCRARGVRARLGRARGAAPDLCLVATVRGRVVGVVLGVGNGFHVFLTHVAVAPRGVAASRGGSMRRSSGAHDDKARRV